MAKRVSVDRTLFTVTVLLVFIGLVMVFSASAVMAKDRFGSPYTFLFRQIAWAAAGIAAMFLYVAGMRMRYFGYALVAVAPFLYAQIFRVKWRYERMLAFVNPWADPQGRGFHIIQSMIAVGTGGLTGVGLMEGKQKLFYLPEPHTDFIFAVISEELGLVGSLFLILLFGVFLWRGLRLSLRAPDPFGQFL